MWTPTNKWTYLVFIHNPWFEPYQFCNKPHPNLSPVKGCFLIFSPVDALPFFLALWSHRQPSLWHELRK
jgi:hypothetical protein